jgi:lysozyme family protein
VAIQKIQRTLGLVDDGIVGAKTLAALNNNPKTAYEKLWQMRAQWLVNISFNGNNRKFLRGWLNRLLDQKYR